MDKGQKVISIAHPEHSLGELSIYLKIFCCPTEIIPFKFKFKLYCHELLAQSKFGC